MGLFDFFKKKKSRQEKMTSAFQEAFNILFPKGKSDYKRQLNDLCTHYDSKYNTDDINVNVIFILTGYLITGNIKNRENSISSVLARIENKMTRSDVEYLHDYVLENHPKLSSLLMIEKMSDTLCKDGYDTDIILGGSGEFGFSPNNPIPTKGVLGIYDYLSRLYDKDNNKVSYTRVRSLSNNFLKHLVDEFQISSAKGTDTLYFYAYHKITSNLCPRGYVLIDTNNIVSNNKSQTDLRNSTPTTDIYGDKLMNRLSDIYFCIKSAAENFLNEMVGLPIPNVNGKLEIEILMAAVLAHDIDKNIVLQSLLSGNTKYNDLDITNILLSIDSYLKSYRKNILIYHLDKRVPLMEFAKVHGKLKIGVFNNSETSESFKAPIFVMEGSKNLYCGFVGFSEDEQTPTFISQNKNDIYVDVAKNGKYSFRLKRDIDNEFNIFIKEIAWYVYVSPLKFQYFIGEEELEEGLKNIKKKESNVMIVSNICNVNESDFDGITNIVPYISYAFNQGVYSLTSLASSLGLIGKFINR